MRPGAVKLIRWTAQPKSVKFLNSFRIGLLFSRAGVVFFFVGFVEWILFLHDFIKCAGTKQKAGHMVFCVNHVCKRVKIDGSF